ncbi:MAG: polysaccharide deacetylase family protein [Steroidobacteraceae bacterium]|jgi:peptidoglycan/xylan/chitin deacetylase (PgdA/CDA1 family)
MTRRGPGYRRLLSSPALSASAAIHVGAAAAALIDPGAWPWSVGAVVANHAALTAAGLWPRSQLLGPNWIRLPEASGARGEVAVTIDDGPDPSVTPRVLALLAQHRALATFFCVGERVERYADLAQEIARCGHAIENHSQRHRHNFSLLGPAGMRAEIAGAQDSIARVTGNQPWFFRAPAGLRNPFLDPVLESLQLRLASWTRRGFDTVNRNADSVYRRLTKGLCGGDIVLLHDGHAALGPEGRPVVLDVLPRLLDAISAHQLSAVTLRGAMRR